MEAIKDQLLELLKTIEGNGSFETSGVKKITIPGLRMNDVVEISLPISETQIKEIIKLAKKAPFGKGNKTITDTTVRSAWEVDAGKLSFHNPDWKKFMDDIIEEVKEGLGIETNVITYSLYKLLIYEPGGFFLPHKDSEKEQGMFGTLVVGLPSPHTGGELIINFDGTEKIIASSLPASNYKIHYVAFFTDCDHEIKPITSGYKVSLVYNLLQLPGSQKLNLSETRTQVTQTALLLNRLVNSVTNKPKAILLSHQYTPANFSLESLKGNDKPRVALLLEAAKKSGCMAQLGLVTHYKMGELESGGYDYYDHYKNDHQENSGDGSMGEVYEEYTTIEHWVGEGLPNLGEISVEKADVIADYEVGDDDPIEESEEDYTGNAGMTMEYWYHYGAIILWPKNYHLELLSKSSVSVRLKWLEYYYENRSNLELNSVEASKYIISQFTKQELTETDIFWGDFSSIAVVLVELKNTNLVIDACNYLLPVIFRRIQINNWAELLLQFDPELFTPLFNNAACRNNIFDINHVLEILKSLLSSYTTEPKLNAFVRYHINQLPVHLANTQLYKLNHPNEYIPEGDISRKEITRAIIDKVIGFSKCKEDNTKWLKMMAGFLTKKLSRTYANKILVPAILNENCVLAKQVKQICIEDLISKTTIKPAPPENWKREVPDTKHDQEIWKILGSFLLSPDMQTFEYKKSQSFRTEMQSAINRVTIDLKMDTIAKGSPHILKITKTQAAYELKLKNWHEDVEVLNELKSRA